MPYYVEHLKARRARQGGKGSQAKDTGRDA
jgi:hypothetical protein